MKKIKWILFDMGSTLINEFIPQQKRIDNMISYLAKHGKTVSAEEIWQMLYHHGKQGSTKPMYDVADKLNIKNVLPYHREGEKPYPDAIECVEELHKYYKLGIVANQPKGSEYRMKKYGFGDFFEFIIGSEDVNLHKPDKRLYKFALSKTNCIPEEILMVGDRPDNDILPAAEVGMKTARIIRGYHRGMPDMVIPDITVKNLRELQNILKK